LRILVAEADPDAARALEETLRAGGHTPVTAADGPSALEALRRSPFDALLAAWSLPGLDGMDLVRAARAAARAAPLICIITAPESAEGRARALGAGADDYIASARAPREALACLATCLARRRQPPPPRAVPAARPPAARPPFVGVAIAASTGGPDALVRVAAALDPALPAAFFAVLHGPGWMLETLVARLRRASRLRARLALDGAAPAPGDLLLAPGDRHLCLDPAPLRVRLSDGPPENYVRPSADPLFRSLARAFGRHGVAVVLTGMGRDASLGAEHVAAAGGVVLAQDPATSVAASMPQTVIDLGIASRVLPLAEVASEIARRVEALSADLAREA
jgi:two-component system chemotaxis response regulator CheB